ncbi:hypothetical protein CN307_32760 [Bacillus cereus]|uniref:Uncharacterized protein n=1 Tax=Bacillus cereus TaxID=1396 RepID=A0A2A8ZSG5_BACCE|nr:hypothetical protein CN307_32760 [Bacillus cereus]
MVIFAFHFSFLLGIWQHAHQLKKISYTQKQKIPQTRVLVQKNKKLENDFSNLAILVLLLKKGA